MNLIFGLFMILIIVACVLLIIIIMAQNPKGGGLSSAFGGSSSASFGVQRTNQFMDKATWILALTVLIFIFLSAAIGSQSSQNSLEKIPQEASSKLP